MVKKLNVPTPFKIFSAIQSKAANTQKTCPPSVRGNVLYILLQFLQCRISETTSSTMSTAKGTEDVNEKGLTETKVETTDHRSPPGDIPPTDEKVDVIHQTQKENPESKAGVLADAKAAVASKVEAAKDAVSGGNKDKDKT